MSLSLTMLLLAAQPAAPAPPAPPATTSVASRHAATPEAIAAGYKLLEASGYDAMMRDTVETLIAGQREGMTERLRVSMSDEVDEVLIGKVGRFIEDEVRLMFRENDKPLRDAFATLYAGYFTTGELERLAVLQADPLMKKANKIMPSMMNELMTLMNGITQKRQAAMQERLMKIISDHVGANPG
jgi:hypothetical protein